MLLGGRRVEHFYLLAQPRLVAVACVLVDGSFFDRFVNKGEGLGKETLGCFPILVFDGFSQVFYLIAEN